MNDAEYRAFMLEFNSMKQQIKKLEEIVSGIQEQLNEKQEPAKLVPMAKWDMEQKQWIKKYMKQYRTNKELTEAYNTYWKASRSEGAIRAVVKKIEEKASGYDI